MVETPIAPPWRGVGCGLEYRACRGVEEIGGGDMKVWLVRKLVCMLYPYGCWDWKLRALGGEVLPPLLTLPCMTYPYSWCWWGPFYWKCWICVLFCYGCWLTYETELISVICEIEPAGLAGGCWFISIYCSWGLPSGGWPLLLMMAGPGTMLPSLSLMLVRFILYTFLLELSTLTYPALIISGDGRRLLRMFYEGFAKIAGWVYGYCGYGGCKICPSFNSWAYYLM